MSVVKRKPKSIYQLFRGRKSRWIQRYYAKNTDGIVCEPENKDNPVFFCLEGARRFIYGIETRRGKSIKRKIENEIIKDGHGSCASIIEWNDESSRSIGDVINLCRRLEI